MSKHTFITNAFQYRLIELIQTASKLKNDMKMSIHPSTLERIPMTTKLYIKLPLTTNNHRRLYVRNYLPNSAVTTNNSSFFVNRSLGDTPLLEWPCQGNEAAAVDLSFGDTITSSITEKSSVHISGEHT